MNRLIAAGLACMLWAQMTVGQEKTSQPIAPAEAKNHVGKKVTVEMTVKAAKKSAKMKRVFLDSLENFQDPDNLGVTINESAEQDLLRQHATADLAEFFRKKTIRVTGTIARRDERTYLDVEKADQIEVVDKSP